MTIIAIEMVALTVEGVEDVPAACQVAAGFNSIIYGYGDDFLKLKVYDWLIEELLIRINHTSPKAKIRMTV